MLICSLMNFICEVSRALGENIQLHLPIILFPLLERASPIGNHSYVQNCAFASLEVLSDSIGYRDVSSLLAANFDYTMDHISLQLRKHAKERTPMSRSLMGVIDVILQSIIRQRCTSSTDENIGRGNTRLFVAPSHVAIVVHMLNCLLQHFDRQYKSQMSHVGSLDTVRVFQSIGKFMESSIDAFVANGDVHVKYEEASEDMLKRLDLELELESPGYDEDDGSDDDVFEDMPYDEGNDDEQSRGKEDEVDTECLREIRAINSILARCSYLLCSPDLQIQVLCSDTLLSGYRSLGKIGSHRRLLRGDYASSPLLPAIAEFWPSIVGRLRSASSQLHSTKTLSRSELSIRHMMATDQEQRPARTGLVVLLSKLLDIVSELCMISDGFFEDRFENDVYPILATLLGDDLPRNVKNMNTVNIRGSNTESKHSTLFPTLKCIKIVYKSSCRYGLAKLIPSIGTMILPLLSLKGTDGNAVMDALQSMLAVDCDTLWRSIHKLSGRPFPRNPMKRIDASNDNEAVIVGGSKATKGECEQLMTQRANQLLEFIKELPEQQLR